MILHSPPRSPSFRLALMVLAAVGASAFAAGSAAAASVSNKTDAEQQIVIIVDNNQTEMTLKPGERLDDVCPKGCIVRIVGAKDGDYVLAEGREIVSIEDGVLYYEGSAPPADPVQEAPRKAP